MVLLGARDNTRINARCTQARKTTHVLDGQHQYMDRTPVEESIRMTEDRDKWRKYIYGVAIPRIEDGYRTAQNCYCHKKCTTYYKNSNHLLWCSTKSVVLVYHCHELMSDQSIGSVVEV